MAKRVIVVGGGIIGASFAYHLAKAGTQVQLLDANRRVGGEATPHSWAWINASWGNPEGYFRLRHHAMSLWKHLDKHIAGLSIQWSGSVLYDLEPVALEAFVRTQASWGYDIRLIEASDVKRLEPLLADIPALAAHAPSEGAVEPVHAVERLLDAARGLDADILQGVRVKRLVEEKGRITGVMTDDGVLEADAIVLATGGAINDLLDPFGLSLDIETPAGLLVHSEPVGEILNGLVLAPRLHVRQTAEGRLVAGTDFGGADPGNDPADAAQRLFAALQTSLVGGEAMRFSHHTIGYRPTPKDGVSAIGVLSDLPGLYVCCTHSGITLAPVLGQLGAQEIVAGERSPLLNGFHPQRLLSFRT